MLLPTPGVYELLPTQMYILQARHITVIRLVAMVTYRAAISHTNVTLVHKSVVMHECSDNVCLYLGQVRQQIFGDPIVVKNNGVPTSVSFYKIIHNSYMFVCVRMYIHTFLLLSLGCLHL